MGVKGKSQSKGDLSEFGPDTSKFGLCGVRIQVVQHSTKRVGQGRWRDCLEVDLADNTRTGLDLEKMLREAFQDLGKDSA